jgi:hypothetical protein
VITSVRLAGAIAALCCVSGCATVATTAAPEIGGIGGAAIADAVTSNGAVAAGIGLGVQAAARAGVQYSQRKIHRAAQDRIANAAGGLEVGAVANWASRDAMLERAQRGRVTVSRVISTAVLQCKEAVFSVDSTLDKKPHSAFYVAIVCQDGARWKWASAEPATERWGGLQ